MSPSRIPRLCTISKRAFLPTPRSMKPSLWIKSQPAFVGAQGKTVLDPDFDIDDSGLPTEKNKLPAN